MGDRVARAGGTARLWLRTTGALFASLTARRATTIGRCFDAGRLVVTSVRHATVLSFLRASSIHLLLHAQLLGRRLDSLQALSVRRTLIVETVDIESL